MTIVAMVEGMDHAQDVERLFSWFKAPMVHYREFAPQTEIAEAVAAWPVMHRAAVSAGLADEAEPGPHGSAAARERLARERMVMPAAAAQAIEAPPLTPPVAETAEKTAGEGPVAALRERLQEDRAERSAAPEPVPAAPRAARLAREAQPALSGFEEPAPAAAARWSEPPRPSRQASTRGVLFGGEYRGPERQARPNPAVDRQDRSLDAVFSRLSGGHDRLPDPRNRARTSPGLGAVFNRLR